MMRSLLRLHSDSVAKFVVWVMTGLTAVPSVTRAAEAPAAAESLMEAEVSDVPRITKQVGFPDGISLFELSNGLSILVQENHTAPVATVRCFVRNTGSIYEGKHLGAGLSHVLEHVVSGGTTTNRTEKQIAEMIDRFGGKTNAFTSSDMTAYFIDCPAKHTAEVIELMADAMQNIAFEPAEFERELKVVKQELADGEANRQRVLWKMLNQTLYLQHPARHPVIGYLDVLDRTDNQAIIDFYHSRYVPNNQVFVVVGDVKTDEVVARIAECYRGSRRAAETYLPLVEEPPQTSPREAIQEMEGETCNFVLAWPTVRLSDPDLYPLDVAAEILTRGESSRLIRRLKRERPLVLDVTAASATPSYVRGWFGVIVDCPVENEAEAEKIVLEEIQRLRDELVPQAELDRIKRKKAADLIFDRETVESSADSLGRAFLATGDPRFDAAYAEAVQQVTAEQVREAARRYFVPQRLNRVAIYPPGKSPARQSAAAAAEESPMQMVRLPNGLRVILKRQANLPLVTMQVAILGGNLVDDDRTAGRSHLVAQMLDKGTIHHPASEIAELFDTYDARVSFDANRHTFTARLWTVRDQFSAAGSLVAECLLKPTFPEDELAKVKQLTLTAIANRKASPNAETMELFCGLLPPSSPFHLLPEGSRESVESLTREDLIRHHARYFVPENAAVAVFGDIEPQAALDLVQEWFGEMKPATTPAVISFDRDNRIPQDFAKHVQTQKPTAFLFLGYTAPSVRDEKDYAAIQVLDTIMSGYGYPGGWLHEELRGQGLVYMVHATTFAGPTPGFFVIMSQTSPDALAEVVSRIKRRVEQAKAGRIDAKEFEIAKQLLTAYHAQENTTIGDQAFQAVLNELYGLGYDYEKTFDTRIEAVTLDDVIEVARRYLGNSILATTSPLPTISSGRNPESRAAP
ncbi:MAG: M16 family metallopeptidase [Thermogutta sp.]